MLQSNFESPECFCLNSNQCKGLDKCKIYGFHFVQSKFLSFGNHLSRFFRVMTRKPHLTSPHLNSSNPTLPNLTYPALSKTWTNQETKRELNRINHVIKYEVRCCKYVKPTFALFITDHFNSAFLKLGVATLFRVTKYFLRVAKVY